MEESLMGGRVHVYMRDSSRFWQCSTYLQGKNRRTSTKQESLAQARVFAEEWYLELRGLQKAGGIKDGKSFGEAAEQFLKEYPVITEGQRNAHYVKVLECTLRLHLIPYFGSLALQEITAGTAQDYRIHRVQTSKTGRPPSPSTIHKEIVLVGQVLKTGQRRGWIPFVPDLSPPFKTREKISHRAWFSKSEYQQLYTATRERANSPKHPRFQPDAQELHDYVLFMANTGLRPDEAARLEFRDVETLFDKGTEETILGIEVRGKRGYGYCKSTSGAVRPFQRLRDRSCPKPHDRVFRRNHRKLFNTILDELNLKKDREGNPRTAYSLRHTYICLRLLEGADIYQIAKNCRTSVKMIEKHYAVHLKNTLDAAAINTRKRAHISVVR